MAGRVVYLDVDDEITSAAARIRTLDADEVGLVLPFGSRVATSRINFRLLSRDALTHDKRLSIVAADAATRSLAASAGLPVFASVAEYEAAYDRTASADRSGGSADTSVPSGMVGVGGLAGAAGGGAGSVVTGSTPSPGAATAGASPTTGAAAHTGATIRTPVGAGRDAIDDGPIPTGDERSGGGRARTNSGGRAAGGRGSRSTLIGGAAILGLAGLVGLVGAYLLLPSATITVAPQPQRIGPVSLTVVADPAATTTDPAKLIVPATQVSVDVSASGTFDATGKRVDETKAIGTVRFENLDFLRTNTIQAGSLVGTNSGVRFRTNGTVTVPKADIVGLSLFPGRIAVNVTAVKPGEDGNVDANTIVIVPAGEDPVALKVTNPAATTGGTHQEFPRVTQEDVDAALTTLTGQLDAAFRTKLTDPSLAPAGTTLFPDTGVLGPITPSTDPTTIVGQEVATFDLSATATGTAVAVDTAAVKSLAEGQLTSAVSPGHVLVPGSVVIEVGDGLAVGQTIRFRVTATAEEIAVLDPDQLKAMVLGKPVDEARAILAPYGTVTIHVWPDWVGTIPNFAGRVTLTIDQQVPVVTPSPSAAPPTGRPTASPSPSPRPTRSATPSAVSPAPSASPS